MTLLPWPKACDYQPYPSEPDTEGAQLRYERARAYAALQRLRVAVEALKLYVGDRDTSAAEALERVGEVPPA
jgi:hypothetical protein